MPDAKREKNQQACSVIAMAHDSLSDESAANPFL